MHDTQRGSAMKFTRHPYKCDIRQESIHKTYKIRGTNVRHMMD